MWQPVDVVLEPNGHCDWIATTVGEFCPFTYGKSLPKRERNPAGPVPVFGSNGIIGYANTPLTNGPTVIIGRKGTVGVATYSPVPCWPIDTTFYVTERDSHLVRFKYYALKCLGLEHANSDSAVPGLNREDAHAHEIRLPDPATQRAIAHILGTLDDKIELNCRMNETLEATARGLFNSWFVDFDPVHAKMTGRGTALPDRVADLFPDAMDDDRVPLGWSMGDLAALVQVNPESWSRGNSPEQVEYVDLANTKWGTIEATQRFSWKEAPSRARRVLRPGDTIIGTVRPGNGSYALIGSAGLTGSTGFAVLRPCQRRSSAFVYFAATAPENIERLAHLADGAAYPSVQPQVVAATRTVVPENTLMGVFSDVASPTLDRIESNARENATLARIRDALLPRLISGTMRVRDAERIVEAAA